MSKIADNETKGGMSDRTQWRREYIGVCKMSYDMMAHAIYVKGDGTGYDRVSIAAAKDIADVLFSPPNT